MKYTNELVRNALEKGFFHLLFTNVFVGFMAFGSQLLVAKFLTPTQMGQIKTIQSYIGVAVVIASFGFNTAVLKLASEARPKEEKAALLKYNMMYTMMPTVAMMVVLYGLSVLGYLSPDPEVGRWMLLYLFVLPASVYSSLLIVYLQSQKRIQLMAKVQSLIRFVGCFFLVVGTYYCKISGYIYVTIAIGYVSVAFLLRLIKNDMKCSRKFVGIFQKSFYYAKWSVGANVIATASSFMDIFMLNFLVTDRVGFGYYSIATLFIMGLNTITMTIQSISTPYFSEKSNNKYEFIRVLKKYQSIVVILSFGVCVVSAIVVPIGVEMLYGEKYAPVGYFFQMLLLKYFFWSCYAVLGSAVVGLGAMKYSFIAIVINTVISIAINYILISRYMLYGAVLAQALSYFMCMIISFILIKIVLRKCFTEVVV